MQIGRYDIFIRRNSDWRKEGRWLCIERGWTETDLEIVVGPWEAIVSRDVPDATERRPRAASRPAGRTHLTLVE